jgi:hypothetical protein
MDKLGSGNLQEYPELADRKTSEMDYHVPTLPVIISYGLWLSFLYGMHGATYCSAL